MIMSLETITSSSNFEFQKFFLLITVFVMKGWFCIFLVSSKIGAG